MDLDIQSKFFYTITHAFMIFFGLLPDMHLLIIKKPTNMHSGYAHRVEHVRLCAPQKKKHKVTCRRIES